MEPIVSSHAGTLATRLFMQETLWQRLLKMNNWLGARGLSR